jgi:P4 family phage/plasmid primase-like protien
MTRATDALFVAAPPFDATDAAEAAEQFIEAVEAFENGGPDTEAECLRLGSKLGLNLQGIKAQWLDARRLKRQDAARHNAPSIEPDIEPEIEPDVVLNGAVPSATEPKLVRRPKWAQDDADAEARVAAMRAEVLAKAKAASLNGSSTIYSLRSQSTPTTAPTIEPETAQSDLDYSSAVGRVQLPAVIPPPAKAKTATAAVELQSALPCDVANQFLADRYWNVETSLSTLLFWQEQFWRWKDNRWRVVDPSTMRSEMYGYLDKAWLLVPRGGWQTYSPKSADVSNDIDALKARVNLEPDVLMPAWLGEKLSAPVADLRDLIPCENGLLDVETRQLLPHTPRFWSANVLEFAYDPTAHAPRFEQFLQELWPGEAHEETRQAVLEMIGVCLTDETKYQKMWMFVGQKRSGKGTLGRVIQGLIGKANYLGTTLQSFGEPFGMENWIGKKVVVFSDANVDGIDRKRMATITERLKNTSGEDPQNINRKNIKYWEGQLTARIIFFSNELLGFRDDSTALASRFITVQMTESFFGHEDKELTNKLLSERAGILNLALTALDRLRSRGAPLQPRSGEAMGEDLARLTSDIAAFIEDRCEIGAAYSDLSSKFFDAWRGWCEAREVRYGWGLSQFGAKLRAASPGLITESRPRSGGVGRPTMLHGIGLRKKGKPMDQVVQAGTGGTGGK